MLDWLNFKSVLKGYFINSKTSTIATSRKHCRIWGLKEPVKGGVKLVAKNAA